MEAIGWRVIAGLAVGGAALGSFATGKYAYVGDGAAFGSADACGCQKEQLMK
jgi:hypothetical protein